MSTRREELLEAARGKFQQLYAEDSGVRHMSEASRENDAETYDPEATLNAFECGLDHSVVRLSEVAGLFNKTK